MNASCQILLAAESKRTVRMFIETLLYTNPNVDNTIRLKAVSEHRTKPSLTAVTTTCVVMTGQRPITASIPPRTYTTAHLLCPSRPGGHSAPLFAQSGDSVRVLPTKERPPRWPRRNSRYSLGPSDAYICRLYLCPSIPRPHHPAPVHISPSHHPKERISSVARGH